MQMNIEWHRCMPQTINCHFSEKCHLYANKRSDSVRIKEQYRQGANLAYLAPPGHFSWVPKSSSGSTKCETNFS